MFDTSISLWEKLPIKGTKSNINTHTASYYKGRVHLYGGLSTDPTKMLDVDISLKL